MKCDRCGQREATETGYCPECERIYRQEQKEMALVEIQQLQAWIDQQPDDADYTGDASKRIRELKEAFGIE